MNADEESYYDLPALGTGRNPLRTLRSGNQSRPSFRHSQLPLIGCGDWNDGMNLIGAEGKGESIWLGFFLYDVLQRFAQLIRSRNDAAFADKCTHEAIQLQPAVETNGWDGDWYKSAPISMTGHRSGQLRTKNAKSIPSPRVGPSSRARAIREEPPRDGARPATRPPRRSTDPALRSPLQLNQHSSQVTSKGYIPGVRENGGQYTHAAIWTAMAFAELGETEAFELFSMLNPIRHATDLEGVNRYKIEPYVVAPTSIPSRRTSDGVAGAGKFSGSSGWMSRLIVETLFGLHLEVDQLHLDPHLPKAWGIHSKFITAIETLFITYRLPDLSLNRPAPTMEIVLDGKAISGRVIFLIDDRREHSVEMKIRYRPQTESAGMPD